MRLFKSKFLVMLILLTLLGSFLVARSVSGDGAFKKRDHSKVHRVGNIWLRVSNYGFFGSGDNSPQWPSLEYPGGSGIDYLYQGALWFGAKKIRRNEYGEKLFWLPWASDKNDVVVYESDIYDSLDAAGYNLEIVLDTLTTVGFDGDMNLYEFLPAWNTLETNTEGYQTYNNSDQIIGTSIQNQRRGVDDDGDGLIDEDPVGYGFPMRLTDELPPEFQDYGSETEEPSFLYESESIDPPGIQPILDNMDIWFPLGFVDLSDSSKENYNFTEEYDDDGDDLDDEDGFPVSEQDYISYYYDYSPFGTPGERSEGSFSQNEHIPLNIRVRQMSYQWGFEYIENLVYVEFDITNMNIAHEDTLFDCAMGIYMDSDVGPQAWGAQERANDDISSYVGAPYEFAYTYDADGDGGLTTGYVGSRVCTPNPDSLEFACWTWEVGDGPEDFAPLNPYDPPAGSPTANQKYWLLTDKNPDPGKYNSLRDGHTQTPCDTRYLFAFYGDQQGFDNPTEASWNLAPGKTMKIVIAVFPGQTLNELRSQAEWAKEIYGQAQNLTQVVEPDLNIHYQAPEPPKIPKVHAALNDNGNAIDVYWDNRSEIENEDVKTVTKGVIGWQNTNSNLDSHISKYDEQLSDYGYFPEKFDPDHWGIENENALINPWTAYRLRHDFQGYGLWGRSGSGLKKDWMEIDRWDKKDTEQDLADYEINSSSNEFINFGGDLGIDFGLPQPLHLDPSNPDHQKYFAYYKYDDFYNLISYAEEDDPEKLVFYGNPLYSAKQTYTDSLQEYVDELYPEKDKAALEEEAWLFASDELKAMGEKGREIYLSLYDDKLIPLKNHGGQSFGYNYDEEGEDEINVKNRLARRYYNDQIMNPPKGIEYYIAVTAWDRGIPEKNLTAQESSKDRSGNVKVIFPGPSAKSNMDNIHVVPNPYVGQSKFDGRRENDEKGDKSRRIWFVNIPEKCKIRIFTLAGDLIDTIHHDGQEAEDIISVSKDGSSGVTAKGIASWDLLSRNNQIIAPGVYLFSVENLDGGDKKVGKFVIIK